MQSTTSRFDDVQNNPIRKISWGFSVSFDKAFDDSITFFTLNTSLLDGVDVLAPTGSSIITEWDKYEYASYTDRVVGVEWTNEMNLFSSIAASMADITLNNYDDYFTPGAGSAIDPYLIPRRPLRILSGFDGETIPQFVGISSNAPKVNRSDRTASIHAEDFLRFIFDRKLDQTAMIVNERIDVILEDLFAAAGVLPSQMNLDVAMTTVPFAYFQKDTTLGYVVGELMEAEMGSLYMDESGIIVFKNRLRSFGDPVLVLDTTNVIDYETSDETKIVNSVSVKAEVREVQQRETIFTLYEAIEILPGQSVTRFLDFADPVTSVDPIDFYTANSQEDGNGTDLSADVSIVTETNFGTTMLVEIENIGATGMYITALSIYGTPAKITRTVDFLYKDQTSIDKFEEQTLAITSPYIQDVSTAESIALTIVEHFKDYGSTVILEIKAHPALQLSDIVTVNVENVSGNYRVVKIVNVISGGHHRQVLTVQKYDIPSYFMLDVSVLDGEDVLAA